MNDVSETLRKRLADFIHGTSYENFSPNVVRSAKQCLLDLIGVSIAGIGQETSSILQGLFLQSVGNKRRPYGGPIKNYPSCPPSYSTLFRDMPWIWTTAIDTPMSTRVSQRYPRQ